MSLPLISPEELLVILNSEFGATRFRRCIAALCLVLLCVITSAAAVHVHRDLSLSTEGTHCLICCAAHASAPTVAAKPLPIVFAISFMPVSADIQATSIISRLELFTRPPPAQ